MSLCVGEPVSVRPCAPVCVPALNAWENVCLCVCVGRPHHGLLLVYFYQFGARASRLRLGPLAPLPPGTRRRTGTRSGVYLLSFPLGLPDFSALRGKLVGLRVRAAAPLRTV
jgi:hypothetical protein